MLTAKFSVMQGALPVATVVWVTSPRLASLLGRGQPLQFPQPAKSIESHDSQPASPLLRTEPDYIASCIRSSLPIIDISNDCRLSRTRLHSAHHGAPS
jgi:hypothetical protein